MNFEEKSVQKMSKSLKNFITVNELIEMVKNKNENLNEEDCSNVIRILFVNGAEFYNTMNFEEKSVEESLSHYYFIREFFEKERSLREKKKNIFKEGIKTNELFGNKERKLLKGLNGSKENVDKALRKNFGMRKGFNEVLKLIES